MSVRHSVRGLARRALHTSRAKIALRVPSILSGRAPLVRAAILLALVTSTAAAQDDLTGFTGTVNLQGAIDGADACDVRVYSNGVLVTSGTSDATGRFDIRFDVSGAVDETLVVWFLPDTDDRVPELLLLKESSNARRSSVWSPCVPREKPSDVVLYDVMFRDEKQLLEGLSESDCFDQG